MQTQPNAPAPATPQAFVAPLADAAALRLCDRLCAQDPALAPLVVPADASAAVAGAPAPSPAVRAFLLVPTDDVAPFLAAIEAIGAVTLAADAWDRRTTRAIAEEAQCATAGERLLWTLATELGVTFDDATRAAWTAAYLACAGVIDRSLDAMERAIATRQRGRFATGEFPRLSAA